MRHHFIPLRVMRVLYASSLKGSVKVFRLNSLHFVLFVVNLDALQLCYVGGKEVYGVILCENSKSTMFFF